MDRSSRRVSLLIVACFALQLTAASAATDVVCSPFVPHTIVVGDKMHDANCNAQTIQNAIDNTVCPNTTIYLTAEETYGGQHLTIQGKSLSIVGSAATECAGAATGATNAPASVPTAPVTTISGNGSQSVIDVSDKNGTGSSVTLRYVEITGGGGGSGSHGGGIDFNGTGSLTIDTSTIDLNSANFGGGIEMNGNGGSATLTLKAYSVIESNTARGNGGGINIEGNAQLVAVQPFTLIGFNHAPNGKGGGIAVVAPARADIGSPGYSALPVFDGNDAALGGAISEQATDAGNVNVNLFTTDPSNPITLSGNFASQAGGAIYLKPSASTNILWFCAADFRIDGNTAPEGSAIFADADFPFLSGPTGTASVLLNDSYNQCSSSFVSQGCAPGIACGTLNGNINADAANHPKPGATIATSASFIGGLYGNRFAMRRNVGAHAIRAIDSDLHINNCLLADNIVSAETLSAEDGGNADSTLPPSFTADSCTIVNNAHNSGSVIHTDFDLTLTYSIIDQPAMSTLSKGNSPAITAHFVLAADPTGLAAQPDIVPGEPTYVDAAAGDYHQRAVMQGGVPIASKGIDFAPAPANDGPDLDNSPRNADVPQVSDYLGIRDLGCYEAQPLTDRLFGDAFGDAMSIVQ